MFALLVLAGLLYLLVSVPPTEWSKATAWGSTVNELGALGVVIVFVLGALATAVGLPRQLLAFVSGFSYGVLAGLLLSLMASIVGCAITFFVSRYFLRRWVQQRYPKTVTWLDAFIKDDPIVKILILRLQPFGTNLLTNLSAGVANIRGCTFLVSSLIGYIPQMLVFSLMGSGVRVGSSIQLLVSLGLLGLSVLLGIWLLRRHQIRQETC